MFDNMDQVTELLRQAAAEFVLPRFRMLAAQEIQEKSPGDLVTIADIEVEHFLSAALPKLLPGSNVVGEEAYSKDHSVLKRLDGQGAVWVVDPVDGTVNFAHGRETFCVMAALVVDGETIMSWIHDPLTDRTATAEKGAGAYWNGERLAVPPAPASRDMHGQINFGFFEADKRPQLKRSAGAKFGSLRRLGCAGHDFLAQARGERHFAFYRHLWSWDHVPGTLLLREAGGYVESMSGEAIHPGERVRGLISAANRQVWNEIRDFLEIWQ